MSFCTVPFLAFGGEELSVFVFIHIYRRTRRDNCTLIYFTCSTVHLRIACAISLVARSYSIKHFEGTYYLYSDLSLVQLSIHMLYVQFLDDREHNIQSVCLIFLLLCDC